MVARGVASFERGFGLHLGAAGLPEDFARERGLLSVGGLRFVRFSSFCAKLAYAGKCNKKDR
eukprot:9740375-Lingulodinium_polyedra.AAC.1